MFSKLITQIKANRFWSSVSYLTLGSTIAQVLGVISTPLLSRIYSVSEFGEFALIGSFSAIFSSLVSLGLPSAIMAPTERKKNIEVFLFVLVISLFFSTLLFIFSIFYSNSISKIFNFENIIVYLIILFLLTISNLIKGLLSILMNKFSENNVLVINVLIGSLTTLLFSIPFGLLGFTKYGLFISAILSSLISIIQMIFRINMNNVKIKFLNIFVFLKTYSSFIIFQFPSNLIEVLSLQIPSQFFSNYYGTNSLGGYYMNEKLLGIPSRLIGTPINTIYFRTASEYYNANRDLSKFTFSLVSKFMFLSFVPVTLIILFGTPIYVFFLGPSWYVAGEISKYLIVLYVFSLTANITSYLRVAINKQSINFFVSLLKVLIVISLIYYSIQLNTSFIIFIRYYVTILSFFYIFDMFINFLLLKRFFFHYLIISFLFIFYCFILWAI